MAKQDALNAYTAAVQAAQTAEVAAELAAAGAVYDTGLADGVASVQSPTGDVTAAQEQIDIAAAVSSATSAMSAQLAALQSDDDGKKALIASVSTAVASLQALLVPPSA